MGAQLVVYLTHGNHRWCKESFIKFNNVAARFRDVHTDVKGLGSFNPDVTTSSAILPALFLGNKN